MNVTCERCQTEYDFDDALVSERGTSVKCTTCGHQFKVFRRGYAGAPERWVVRRVGGAELVFGTLRELQRALATGRVQRDDMLSKGDGPARALGTIDELSPFFASGPEAFGAQSTPTPGAAIPAQTGRTERPPAFGDRASGEGANEPPPRLSRPDATVEDEPPRSLRHPLPPTDAPTVRRVVDPTPIDEPPTLRRASRTSGEGFAVPRDVVVRGAEQIDLTPSDVRASYLARDEGERGYVARDDVAASVRFTTRPPARARGMRSVAAFAALGVLVGVGVIASRKLIESKPRAAASASEGSTEARVGELVASGEKALAEFDLEAAKEAFDKASALADRDARARVGLATLATLRADLPFLRARLLAADQGELAGTTRRELVEQTERARRAVDHAAEVAPEEPATVRARIDALRLAGDRDGARSLAARLGTAATRPESLYVLAMLDLVDDAPPWPSIVDRLRIAASGERVPGRARAALAYALVQSGDRTGANVEIDRIGASSRPHPLALDLRAFAARVPLAAPAASASASADAGRRLGPEFATGDPSAPGTALGAHELLKQAAEARAAAQLDKAEALYNAALSKNPGDSEALGGLGDVARARGNHAAARFYYEKVLATNPSYVPVAATVADMRWEAGDRAGAAALYRQIVDSASGAIAARAKERLAQLEVPRVVASTSATPVASAEPRAPTSATPRASSAPATSAPPSDLEPAPAPAKPATKSPALPPGVDTSDLPELRR